MKFLRITYEVVDRSDLAPTEEEYKVVSKWGTIWALMPRNKDRVVEDVTRVSELMARDLVEEYS